MESHLKAHFRTAASLAAANIGRGKGVAQKDRCQLASCFVEHGRIPHPFHSFDHAVLTLVNVVRRFLRVRKCLWKKNNTTGAGAVVSCFLAD